MIQGGDISMKLRNEGMKISLEGREYCCNEGVIYLVLIYRLEDCRQNSSDHCIKEDSHEMNGIRVRVRVEN